MDDIPKDKQLSLLSKLEEKEKKLDWKSDKMSRTYSVKFPAGEIRLDRDYVTVYNSSDERLFQTTKNTAPEVGGRIEALYESVHRRLKADVDMHLQKFIDELDKL